MSTDAAKLAAIRALGGKGGSVTDPLPLLDPNSGEPLDPKRYWLKLRRPDAQADDNLQAERGRQYTETIVESDRSDPSKTKVTRRSYVDTRLGPFLKACFDNGIVRAGVLPFIEDDDSIGEHRLTGDADDDWAWLCERTPGLFNAVWGTITACLWNVETSEVVAEGEGSAAPSDTSMESPDASESADL